MKVRGIFLACGNREGSMRNSLIREGANLRETEKFTNLGFISNFGIIMVVGWIGEFGIITDALAKSTVNHIRLRKFGRRRCITSIKTQFEWHHCKKLV